MPILYSIFICRILSGNAQAYIFHYIKKKTLDSPQIKGKYRLMSRINADLFFLISFVDRPSPQKNL